MGIVAGQQRTLLELLGRLGPMMRSGPPLAAAIERILRGDRRFGASDRRLHRELLYTAVRHLPWIEEAREKGPDVLAGVVAWLAADTPDTRSFRAAVCAGAPEAPRRVADRAAGLAAAFGVKAADPLLPGWFRAECPAAFEGPDYDALNTRAPLWIRLSAADPGPVLAELSALGLGLRPSPALPGAAEVLGSADLTRTDSHRLGLLEIQDVGSQLVLPAAGVRPGGRWLDLCAGAGGKALQLAALLGVGGRVDAFDVRAEALVELRRRASRAGLGERIRVVDAPGDGYDGVLVDAPCSGSGTWRRAPHLKWSGGPEAVAAFARRQSALLQSAARRVRPGGVLVYATCSLCRSENEGVVSGFLEANPAFSPAASDSPGIGEARGPGRIILPSRYGGDGFFCAALMLRP
jgi:16S rRNA (cytosine967-C5)-methyltransferase